MITAERADEKLHRRSTVRMGIRIVQLPRAPPLPLSNNLQSKSHNTDEEEQKPNKITTTSIEDPTKLGCDLCSLPPPHATIEKPFILSDGKVHLEASLDKAVYCHGDSVMVNVHIQNHSNKTVRRIKVYIVSNFNFTIFNGYFKCFLNSPRLKR